MGKIEFTMENPRKCILPLVQSHYEIACAQGKINEAKNYAVNGKKKLISI